MWKSWVWRARSISPIDFKGDITIIAMPTQIVHDFCDGVTQDLSFKVHSIQLCLARRLSSNDTPHRNEHFISAILLQCEFMHIFTYFIIPSRYNFKMLNIAISRTCYFTWTWQNCFALSCQVTRSKVDGCKHLENS